MILSILVAVSIVLICAGLVKFGSVYLDSYRLLLRSNCFRGPKAYPIVGNGYLFMGNTTDIYNKLQMLMTKYESPFRLWLGPQLYFALHDAEQIKRILLHPDALEKSRAYDILRPLLGGGLITAEVSKWRPHRKAIEPLFNRKALESFVQVSARNASSDIEKMVMENQGKEFDVTHYMSRYVFYSIVESSMGAPLGTFNGENSTIFDIITEALDITGMRIMGPWLYPDLIFKFTPVGRKFYKNVKSITSFVMDCHDKFKNDVLKHIESRPNECLLAMLLNPAEDDCKFTDDEILAEEITILGAGFETSASLLVEAIFILANNPQYQDKVYAEVHDVCGKSNLESLNITLQDIERMEYLNRFVKETLRIFPPVPVISRYLSADINIGEYTLPATSSVMINITQTHRNEKYWPKPLEFIPDRFLPDHPLGPRHPYAFIPFSGGPRNCIGMKYAMISVKVLLVVLISKYIIKTRKAQEVLDLRLKMCVSLKMQDPIMISLERRCSEVS